MEQKPRLCEKYCYNVDYIAKSYFDTKTNEQIIHIWNRHLGVEIGMKENTKENLVEDLYLNWHFTTEEEIDKIL